jgi:hypothetical protein
MLFFIRTIFAIRLSSLFLNVDLFASPLLNQLNFQVFVVQLHLTKGHVSFPIAESFMESMVPEVIITFDNGNITGFKNV